jgi:hypothetical protein
MKHNPHLTEREQREQEEIERILAALEQRRGSESQMPRQWRGDRAPRGQTVPHLH